MLAHGKHSDYKCDQLSIHEVDVSIQTVLGENTNIEMLAHA